LAEQHVTQKRAVHILLTELTCFEDNRPLRKSDNAGFVRIFAARQEGSDDAHHEGAQGTANAGLWQKNRKDGVERLPKRSN